MAEQGKTATIDGKEYVLDTLSQKARDQLSNVRATDQEIARLKTQLAIAQTARAAYARVLKGELEQDDVAVTVQ